MPKDTRLIERWLPIAEIGIESLRERTPMTPFPAPNRLHVWWARRPLIASRAAILASILPADADHKKFLHALGIHGDPVAVKHRLDLANRNGERLAANPYGYDRAFKYSLDAEDLKWVSDQVARPLERIVLLDPTAGGGSIPFEAERIGVTVEANELNPVAALILRATIDAPVKYGTPLADEFDRIAEEFIRRATAKYDGVFPPELPGVQILGYLWARTIVCPYCDGLVPLSPNWRLAPDGTGVRLKPDLGKGPGSKGRRCSFEIVKTVKEQSSGTVADGDATCPFTDCARVIDGDDEVKRQAQAGQMRDQLYAVVFKQRIEVKTKTGKIRGKWERGYRAPHPEDDNSEEIKARLAEKMIEWESLDIVPNESYGDMYSDRSKIYGVNYWRDLFSARQLLCHGTGVEIFREFLEAEQRSGMLSEVSKAAFVYLALAIDKLADYNSRMTRWHTGREVMVNTFDRHDFSFKWSYAEMAPLIVGLGYDWAIEQVSKCIDELVEMARPDTEHGNGPLFADGSSASFTPPPISITCKSAENLDHLADASIDVIVMDPPYYDNVMYAELSDFFYVWLKRTAGRVIPELFTRALTDKEHEAVANPAKFKGQPGAKALAGRD